MKQFRQLGFKFADRLFDSLTLQLFKMEAEFFCEQSFDMCLKVRQKLLYFLSAQ